MATRRRRSRVAQLTATPSQPIHEWLLDAGVRHALAIDALKAGESERIGRFLETEMVPELRRRIGARLAMIDVRGYDSGPWASRHLATLSRTIQQITARSYGQVDLELRRLTTELARSEAAWQTATLERAIPFRVSVSEPTMATLRAATRTPILGRDLETWFRGLAAGQSDAIAGAVRMGLVAGDSTRTITSAAVRTSRVGIRQAQTLTRTAITHAASSARVATFGENYDILRGEQWVSTLDARTTDICIGLDGKIFGLAEGPRPPAHHQCRSITVPVLRPLSDILGARRLTLPDGAPRGALRAAFGGPQQTGTSFGEWFARQPPRIQDVAVGPTRARAIRAGRLSHADLRSPSYPHRRYTLDELRARGFDL